MKYYPSRAKCCEADVTKETAVIEQRRNGVVKRAKMIFHYRKRDDARFWHWSDQDVEAAP